MNMDLCLWNTYKESFHLFKILKNKLPVTAVSKVFYTYREEKNIN